MGSPGAICWRGRAGGGEAVEGASPERSAREGGAEGTVGGCAGKGLAADGGMKRVVESGRGPAGLIVVTRSLPTGWIVAVTRMEEEGY